MKKLTSDQRAELERALKKERDNRVNDAVKIVLWHDDGLSAQEIASLLYIDDATVYRKLKEYHDNNNLKPKNKGGEPILSDEESEELEQHVEENCYVRTNDIQSHVFIKYNKKIGCRALTYWLHKYGFSFKKPKLVPRADPEAQAAFIKYYEELEARACKAGEPVLFIDSVHPSQQTRAAYGWIRTGEEKVIKITSARKRLNVMGAINLEDMKFTYSTFETINSNATIDFFKQLEDVYKYYPVINVILDNAGYYISEEVEIFLKTSNITVHYLPPRSPNLNSIERLWKVMHEFVSNNKVYEKFADFKAAILHFFDGIIPTIHELLINRVTNAFKVI